MVTFRQEQDNNTNMYHLTNFIYVTMNSILRKSIIDGLSLSDAQKNVLFGWIEAVMPFWAYSLRSGEKNNFFDNNEDKLTYLWLLHFDTSDEE